jgi:outer membrane protein
LNGQDVPIDIYSKLNITPASGALTISQPILQGFQTVARTRQADAGVMAARARLLASEQQVLFDAASAYVDVVRDRELLTLNDSNVAVLGRQLQATTRRLQAGEVTQTDVAQAELRLSSARAARSQANAALQNSRAAYERVIGEPPGALVPPQPLAMPFASAEAVRSFAAINNPTVVASAFDAASARAAINVQFGQFVPQLSLQGQLYRDDNASSIRGYRVKGESITANLTIPLYQGGAEYSAVRQAREQAVQARRLLDDQRRVAVENAAQAWAQLVAAEQQAELDRRSIGTGVTALDGVQREALIGSRTTLDVLNAELELLNARVALIQAVADVIVNSYGVAFAAGRLTAQDLALPVPARDWEAHYRAVRASWAGLGG